LNINGYITWREWHGRTRSISGVARGNGLYEGEGVVKEKTHGRSRVVEGRAVGKRWRWFFGGEGGTSSKKYWEITPRNGPASTTSSLVISGETTF